MFVITVPSTTEGKTYTIRRVTDDVWICDCKDHTYRSKAALYTCRHLAELTRSLVTHVATATASEKAKDLLKVTV